MHLYMDDKSKLFPCPAKHAARLAAVHASILMHKLMLLLQKRTTFQVGSCPSQQTFGSEIKQYLVLDIVTLHLFCFDYWYWIVELQRVFVSVSCQGTSGRDSRKFSL